MNFNSKNYFCFFFYFIQFNSIDCHPQSNLNVPNVNSKMGQSSNVDIDNYENSNFSKWSDCSFETPFVPIQRDVSVGPQKKQEDKIRRNLFGNSYFNDQSSSSQMMKSGPVKAQNEPNGAERIFGQTQNSMY